MSPTPTAGRLHVLTDETLGGRYGHLELARLAAEGGADVVQLREKRPRSERSLVELACRMLSILSPRGVRLVVDDRIEVARASGAAGVHLGRDDAHPETALRALGPGKLIGRTANSLDEARRWSRDPVTYLGVGPVYGTTSKADPAPALGCATLARIVRAVDRPVIAIGSIRPEHVEELLASGAHGVAVLSAVTLAGDPAAATRRFREAIDAWLAGQPAAARGRAG